MDIFQKPFGENQHNQGDVGTGGIEFIAERHVACVFLLDTSGSMQTNNAIGKLNEGLREFKKQVMDNKTFSEHTKSCIDVALISFGPDIVLHTNTGATIRRGQDFDMASAFVPVRLMNPPVLSAGGGTPLGEALDWALDIIGQQKKRYSTYGTPYFRPWVFCITDGEPNSGYQVAAQRLKQMEEDAKVLGYCVGVEGFNKDTMASIFDTTRIFKLANLDFPGLFEFLSNSFEHIRNSGTAKGKVAANKPSTLELAF
jgi:uncharacterized protein YegL